MNIKDLLLIAVVGAMCLFSPLSQSHTRSQQECDQAAEMVYNVAQSRDTGKATRADVMSAFAADIAAVQQYAPEQRWFVMDEADAQLLYAGVLSPFEQPNKTAHDLAVDFLGKCMDVRVDAGSAVRVASSQHLVDEQFCRERIFDVNTIAEFVVVGAPKQDVHDLVDRSPELSEDRAASIHMMIDEAYDYKGDITDWMKSRMQDCQ